MGLSPNGIRHTVVSSMSFSHFLRIQRDEQAGTKHYIVHTVDPRFSMELVPDRGAPDKVGKGVIKRICLPNSWSGNYGKCANLIGSAQEFFAQTFATAETKVIRPRFLR
jgi:hypothetical protein